MSIYTKKGDEGNTSLFGGSKLSKGALRVESYGSVDEINANLGVVYANIKFDELKKIIRKIQEKMFVLGAQLASDENGQGNLQEKITKEDIKYLENIIDKYIEEYGELTGFIIPGETLVSAQMHVTRTVIRRCERSVVNLSKEEFVCPYILKYINRLSDTMFILAKVEVQKSFIKKVIDNLQNKLDSSNNTQLEKENSEELFHNIFHKNFLDGMYNEVSKKSKELGVPISFSVADKQGNLVFFARDINAILPSITISQNKAYTSSVLKMSTDELSKHTGTSGSLFGINTNNPKLVIFGGGQCLVKDGTVIGAIGVSGGSVDEDIEIGNSAIKYFERYFCDERR